VSEPRLIEDPRLPALIAAVLGLIAGLAAKQAIALQAGVIPKPLEILADILILGMILIIVMTAHYYKPNMPVESVALMAAVLAMWGPRGVGALVAKIRKGMDSQLQSLAKTIIEPVEPAHRATMVDTHGVVLNPDSPNQGEQSIHPLPPAASPVAKLRDVLPLESHIPVDQADAIARLDQATSDDDGDDNG
jgi:hypothetical protein